MADDTQDKRLPASQRKITKARGEGQVARSRDLGHLVAFGAGGLMIYALAEPLTGWLKALMAEGLRFDAARVAAPRAMATLLAALGLKMMLLVVPLGGVLALMAVAAGVITGGWNFTFKALQPKLSKFDPIAGLGRMVSKHQLTEMLKAVGLALVLLTIGAVYLRHHLDDFARLIAQPLPLALSAAGRIVLSGLLLLVLALAAFTLVDVPL